MKKIIEGCLLLSLLAACGHKKAQVDPFVDLTNMVDSASLLVRSGADSLCLDVPEEPKPSVADELFDDFIFNYASDSALQRQRTAFPLTVEEAGGTRCITEKDWQHDYLFSRQNCYTLLFDRERELDVVEDTSLTSVQVEWIDLQSLQVKSYCFERKKGMWMLDGIRQRPLRKGKNLTFVEFYAKFATDSVYQLQHVRQPLRYVTIDPDDEFSILETTLDASQWMAFRPMLPADGLSNINYGQKNNDLSNVKIMKVNGIGNGYSNIYYFRKRNGEWELYKYEDSSI